MGAEVGYAQHEHHHMGHGVSSSQAIDDSTQADDPACRCCDDCQCAAACVRTGAQALIAGQITAVSAWVICHRGLGTLQGSVSAPPVAPLLRPPIVPV